MKKPGYKTTEFWFTLVSFVFSGLYLMGVIGDISQKEDLIRDVSHGVESVILIGGQLMILYKYISSRVAIKQEEAAIHHTEPQLDVVTIDDKNTSKVSTKKKGTTNARNKRTDTSRSRKTNKSSKNSPK